MGSNDPMPLIIRLPHLKQFSLRGGAQSLTILEAPMLDELKLEFHIHRDLPSVTSFLSRSSWTIQRLTIGRKLVKSRNGLETLTALLSFAQARLSSLAE